MPQLRDLDLGMLKREEKERRTTTQTVHKYFDKKGKARFVGTSELSKSQKLGPHYFFCMNRFPKNIPCTCVHATLYGFTNGILISIKIFEIYDSYL